MNKKDLLSNNGISLIKNKKDKSIVWTNIFLLVSLFAVVFGALVSTKISSTINKNIADAKEAVRPAKVKIIKIITSGCVECFNVNEAVSGFKKLNVKVDGETTLQIKSKEANELIKRFGIKKLPTYLVTGEVKKNNLENFVKDNGEVKGNTFIFTKITPVYINTATGKEMGKVTATLITDFSCPQCFNSKPVIENFRKSGVKINYVKEVDWNSSAGQAIISRYKITKVPSFIFSSEFDLYDNTKSSWQNFGTVEDDRTYVARNLPLPYRDLTSGQITGLVNIIYLTDSSCEECYKVQDVQKPILTQSYRVALQSERFVETSSAEGQNLISKYSISKVPTILLSPEIDQYVDLKNVWKNVGIIETDGWYVFTGFNQLGNIIYKDLASGQIVKPTQQGGNQAK